MDIEERCGKAVNEYIASLPNEITQDFYWRQELAEADFRAGYMAGVAQTQRDYSAYYNSHE